jgi:hypothetical protein
MSTGAEQGDTAAQPPQLSPEIVAALEQGPGMVQIPVVDELVTAEEFIAEHLQTEGFESLGNFSGYFLPVESYSGAIYRGMACRQRFAILYPELTAELEGLAAAGVSTTWPGPEGIVDKRFAHAYTLMSGLVDRNDAAVVTSDGQVDSLLLVR